VDLQGRSRPPTHVIPCPHFQLVRGNRLHAGDCSQRRQVKADVKPAACCAEVPRSCSAVSRFPSGARRGWRDSSRGARWIVRDGLAGVPADPPMAWESRASQHQGSGAGTRLRRPIPVSCSGGARGTPVSGNRWPEELGPRAAAAGRSRAGSGETPPAPPNRIAPRGGRAGDKPRLGAVLECTVTQVNQIGERKQGPSH